MSKKKTFTDDQFNQLVSSILVMYSKYLKIPDGQVAHKIMEFNTQLDKQIQAINQKLDNEKSI